MKVVRLATVSALLLAGGCGGGVEDVGEVGDGSATARPPSSPPVVLVGMTGTVTRVDGKWPREPSITPFAGRVVLVKPGGRFSPRNPRLEDAQIGADVQSSTNGTFAIAAPPGDYFLFAVSNEQLVNDRGNHSGVEGGPSDVRLEAGKPVRREIVIDSYLD